MYIRSLAVLVVALTSIMGASSTTFGQSAKAATYITDEEVKTVLATPGIDHTIKVVDIGNENFAVGIIHRGATTGGAARGGGAAPAAGAGAAAADACGEPITNLPANAISGITHDSQTEGYIIVSGGGTLVTGGHIVNGRKSPPDGAVTKELNGPSCSGMIVGSDVVLRPVKTGDIIIIPAGVAHGWTDITDHVDYLSLRPSDHVLQAGYVHPSIKR
jgi:mannose-6-phosphate isomerase-like protein (cupin superfamily)